MLCPDWFPQSAGLAQSCYELCKQLEKHGHEVRIVIAKEKKLDDKGMHIISIPYVTRLLGRNPLVFGLYQKVKKHLDWCDVVGVFSYMYLMNSQIVSIRKQKKFSKPIIHFYRGSLEQTMLPYISFSTRIAKKIYDATFAKPIFQDVDLIISNAEPPIALMKEKYHVASQKLCYINNALSLDEYHVQNKKEKRILFVGRLIENKGILLFPEIIKYIPSDWTFTVIGDGPLRSFVEKLQKKHKNIEILGKIPHKDLTQIMSSSAILILPTYAEGSPRAVMEAAACGIPSIAFAVGDVINMIPSGKGYAIPPYDIDLFCKKMRYLIDHKQERLNMGKKARQFAEKKLDWDTVYPRIEKIIKKTISEYKQ